MLKKKVGDRIQIETSELSVVGIVNGGAWVENSSVILSLSLLQEITGNQGKINVIDIRVTPAEIATRGQECTPENGRCAHLSTNIFRCSCRHL
jgi:hypothetical protein